MVNTKKASVKTKNFLSGYKPQAKKHFKLMEKNYQNNTDSDYTEKIEELGKTFNYPSNSNHYWSEPELSILYGTPLYEAASPSQKMALNQLYWVTMYNQAAASENETIIYNQITASVFSTYGYETVADELALETEQERTHIRAFSKINYNTLKALLGKQAFKTPKNPLIEKSDKFKPKDSSLSAYHYYALRFIVNMMLKSKEHLNDSTYLRELEEKNEFIPAPNQGFWGRGLAPMIQFFSFNWGGSPFLACQYYTLRFMANMNIKEAERYHSKYYRYLEKKGEFIPTPTAVSRYHFLDEAFHTTTSLFIARDLYKDLPEPTAYEKLVGNISTYMAQRNVMSGLSAVIPGYILRDDYSSMLFIYKLLQAPLFGMPAREALHWMNQCFCYEHEGFNVSAKIHQQILSDIRQVFADINHLWPINREMRLMASGGAIDKAIQSNIKTFKQFSRAIAQSN